jgi:hypothetical protein
MEDERSRYGRGFPWRGKPYHARQVQPPALECLGETRGKPGELMGLRFAIIAVTATACLSFTAGLSSFALAQDNPYPAHAVRLIVPSVSPNSSV